MAERRLSPLFTWRSAICDSALPPTTRHVLLTLSLHMNERGGSCFPSTRTLASETGLSRRSVEKHLRLAHDARWIQKREQGRKADGTYRRAEYTATVPGEAGSPGPGESDAQPGEPNDIDQGKEVPHRTSVLRGRQKRGRQQQLRSVLSEPASADVENVDENELKWNDRLAPLARKAGGDSKVADWLRRAKRDPDYYERVLIGLVNLRDRGALDFVATPGEKMSPAILAVTMEGQPIEKRATAEYWRMDQAERSDSGLERIKA